MRRWSRAVALLCMVYVLGLLVVHRRLDPANEIFSDDYTDVREEPPLPHLIANNSNARARGVQRNLQLELHQLEASMAQLEREISDVKAKLINEAKSRLKEQGKAKENQEQQQQEQLRFQQEEQKVARGERQLQQQEDHRRQQQGLDFEPEQQLQRGLVRKQGGPGHDDYKQQNVKTAGQFRQKPARVVRQPLKNRQPSAVGGRPEAEIARDRGVALTPDEDYKDSSFVKIGEGVSVYSAYHDDRQPDQPVVRLIVILSAPKPARGILCHFDTSNLASPMAVEATEYELCENHKKQYLGFIYSCPVPKAVGGTIYTLYLSLKLTPHSRVKLPLNYVAPPQVKNNRQAYRYNYSICVSPLFGSVHAKRLVEFLELTRILGVQHVFFYDYQVSSVIQRVLQYYQNKDWVTLLPWKMPSTINNGNIWYHGQLDWVTLLPWKMPSMINNGNIWYHGQLVSNNDCLYRTMALSAFTAFHDIDEFIVPHEQHVRTWGELFPAKLPNDTCGYSFKSAFYDPGLSSSYPDDLMTVALTARPNMLSKVRTKVLVDPRRVFEVGIHHISKQFQEHWQPQPFDPNRAILHHYRNCIGDFGMRCENWVKDTTIGDKYFSELKENFQQAVRTLRL